MPQQRKKKERSGRLRGERDQIKFIDLGFERWQVVRFRYVIQHFSIYQFLNQNHEYQVVVWRKIHFVYT